MFLKSGQLCFSKVGSRVIMLYGKTIEPIFEKHDMFQDVAVCCSVLQCVAVGGSGWQWVAVCCSVLQCVAV